MDRLQLQYLEAIGIQAWVSRDLAPPREIPAESGALSATALRLGPGEGGCLFVCEQAEQSGGRLAADLARACREQPVWAWPEDAEGAGSVEDAVRERLFTAIIVFGPTLASRLVGAPTPEALGTARVMVAPGLETVAADPAARRACWAALCRAGVAGSR